MKRSAGIITAILLLLSFINTNSYAEGYAGQAGAFLRMGAGAVSMGSGDAGVARSLGVEQTHYNPAGLTYNESNEIHLGYHVLSLDRKIIHAGALYQISSIPLPNPNMGVLRAEKPVSRKEIGLAVFPEGPKKTSELSFKLREYIDQLVIKVIDQANGTSKLSEEKPPLFILRGYQYRAPDLLPLIYDVSKKLEGLPDIDDRKVRVLVKDWFKEKQMRYLPENTAAVALNWTHGGTDDIDGRGYDGDKYQDFSFNENRISMSFGLRIIKQVAVGVNVGVLYAHVPDVAKNDESLTSTTMSGDIGVQFRPFTGMDLKHGFDTIVIGAAVYGLNGKNTWNTTDLWSQGTTKTDEYPDRYRFGFSYSPMKRLETFCDIETDLDAIAKPKYGVAYDIFPVPKSGGYKTGTYGLTVRAGMNEQDLSFGFGVSMGLFGAGMTRLEYAYVAEDVSPEPTQVISWRFTF